MKHEHEMNYSIRILIINMIVSIWNSIKYNVLINYIRIS